MAVHDLLVELLRHPPRPMHLVLASRREPSIDLTRLRARNQVMEVRTENLRFTKEETTAFLEQELRISVKTSALQALVKRVEGWAAGLRLITLSLLHRDSVDRRCITTITAHCCLSSSWAAHKVDGRRDCRFGPSML
jgi:LuxR family maltose regulon positive regulatory protein